MILKEGELFHGRYRIISQLGEGSVGTVYRATQIDSGREVALKLLQATFAAAEKDRERFLREFRILAQLCHEHIITFYSAAISPEGFPYAVFEFISGSDLHQTITKEGRLPFGRVIKIAEQICFAMEYAHNQGIIHRDLKPENIMLLDKPESDWVKVLDFGFARDVSQASSSSKQKLTATGMVVGTVCYMSPEQCKGAKAEIQSDIYALACIIYEGISGKLLFEADSPLGVVHKQIYEDPAPALKQLQALAPDELLPVLKKALDKDPAKRQQSMLELRRDLQSLPREHSPQAGASLKKAIKVAISASLLLICISGTFLALSVILALNKSSPSHDTARVPRISKLLSVQSPDSLLGEAENLIERREYTAAELRLNLALDKALREKDQDGVFRAESLLTKICLLEGDRLNSELRANRAVATAKKYFGTESTQYFKALRALGNSCKSTDPERAKSIFKGVLKQWASVNQTATSEFVNLLNDYIDLLQKAGANELADKTLLKYKTFFDSKEVHPYVLNKFLCLQAGIKYKLGKDKEAEHIAKLGAELTGKERGLNLQQRLDSLIMWSNMFFFAGRKESAIQYIQEAESMSKSAGSEPQLAELYIGEARMLQSSGEAEKALTPLERAYLLINPKTMPKPNVLLTEICYSQAVSYMKLSQLDKATHCITEAINICPADATAMLVNCSDLQKQIEKLKHKSVK